MAHALMDRNAEDCWWADMGPVEGHLLRPFGIRLEALAVERAWLVGGGT
jgi:hypothetical protein